MPDYDPTNIFAKILTGDIPCDKVGENEVALAFRDINAQAPTHLLVIPKGAYVSFADFSTKAEAQEQLGFWQLVSQTAKAAGLEGSGYRIVANHGPHAHQEVPHFHIHICGGRALGPLLAP